MCRHKTLATRTLLLFGACFATASACLSAQAVPAAPPPPVQKVQLASDLCPVVHPGDVVSVDWNPAFDPSWAVSGMRYASLTFAPLNEDGVSLRRRSPLLLGGRNHLVVISAVGNGYFHVELPVPGRTPAGIYRLIDVQAGALVRPEYNGSEPKMMVSPVRDRLCFNVTFATQQAGDLADPKP